MIFKDRQLGTDKTPGCVDRGNRAVTRRLANSSERVSSFSGFSRKISPNCDTQAGVTADCINSAHTFELTKVRANPLYGTHDILGDNVHITVYAGPGLIKEDSQRKAHLGLERYAIELFCFKHKHSKHKHSERMMSDWPFTV